MNNINSLHSASYNSNNPHNLRPRTTRLEIIATETLQQFERTRASSLPPVGSKRPSESTELPAAKNPKREVPASSLSTLQALTSLSALTIVGDSEVASFIPETAVPQVSTQPSNEQDPTPELLIPTTAVQTPVVELTSKVAAKKFNIDVDPEFDALVEKRLQNQVPLRPINIQVDDAISVNQVEGVASNPHHGPLYYQNGKIRYIGNILYEVEHGFGAYYDKNGKIEFIGISKYGELTYATHHYEDGVVRYTGTFVNGKYEGSGKWFDENGTLRYDGEFKNGLCEGIGTWFDENGIREYHGPFVAGQFSGEEGTYFYPNQKTKYIGPFAANKFEGIGILFDEGQCRFYKGDFRNGMMHGKGIIYHPNGTQKYRGNLKYGVVWGYGETYDAEDRIIYAGPFVNGLREGRGKIFYDTGELEKDAVFKKGNPHSDILHYTKSGKLIFQGNARR